ncbi:23553_t:CDS:2 [Cetraspora pellucida]|uniref:23553_t:CDS:1 n=1 Tax=Cetraspora pellucida TaxID=1433469 RepID=A0A9N8WHZ9_9GLOM|nr:23553_t:CDS:2 [Cetraspora pellucida]
MNKSNDYSNMEITLDNQNNSKRRNETWCKVQPQTKNLSLLSRNTNQFGLSKKVQRSSRKNDRSFRETSNELRPQTKFGGSISEAIDLTETEQPYEESVSQRTLNNNEKTMNIRATPVPGNSHTNDSSTRFLQVPNGTTYESRTTTPEETGSVQCKICSGTLGQHEYWDCPNTISECKEYQCEYCLIRGHKQYQCKELLLDKANEYNGCGCNSRELEHKEKLIECYLCKKKGTKREFANYGNIFFCTWEEKYAYQIYLDIVDPCHNYTYEGRKEHWLNTKQLAGNYITINRSITPILYNKENNDVEEEIAYNQAVTENLNNLDKGNTKRPETYDKWCKETSKVGCTFCKECLLSINIKEQRSEEDLAKGICRECYTKEKGKAK